MKQDDKKMLSLTISGVTVEREFDPNTEDEEEVYKSMRKEIFDLIEYNKINPHVESNIHVDFDKLNISMPRAENRVKIDDGCFLTTACMKHYMDEFDDNCEELVILRWFRDNFVTEKDIEYYYLNAPVIVKEIEKLSQDKKENIYNYIYNNVIKYCIDKIKTGEYELAYFRYRACVLSLTDEFVREKDEVKKLFIKH